MITILKQEMICDIKKIYDLQEKINQLEKELEEVQKYITYIDKNGKTREKHISSFQKLFNSKKTKELIEYKEKNNKLSDEIESLYRKKGEKRSDLRNLYHRDIFSETKSLDENIKAIEKAQTLQELNFSFENVLDILKQKGCEVVLEENDISKAYNHFSDYVLVHLTNYIPENNQILRMMDKGAKYTIEKPFGTIEFSPSRETTHLRVNGGVADVGGGFSTWGDKKYAIIIPMTEIPKDAKITSPVSVDFQIQDKVNLTDKCYVLCPKGEEEKIKAYNSNVQVIPYQGEYARDFANQFIEILGYRYIEGGDWGFNDFHEQNLYNKYITEHFGSFAKVAHDNSIQNFEEKTMQTINILKALENGIINGNVIYSEKTNYYLDSFIAEMIGQFIANYNRATSPKLDKAKEEFMKIFHLDSVEEIIKYREEYTNLFMQHLKELSELIEKKEFKDIEVITETNSKII